MRRGRRKRKEERRNERKGKGMYPVTAESEVEDKVHVLELVGRARGAECEVRVSFVYRFLIIF